MEVYTAVFDHNLQQISPPSATIVDAHAFDDLEPDQRIILFGSGADKLVGLFADNERIEVIAGFKNSARHLSQLAYRSFRDGLFADVAYFEPYYLKDFVATIPKKGLPSL